MPARAQPPAADVGPAHIAVVDGAADVERDGVSQPAIVNAPIVPGDRLRSGAGRVEIWFPDGSALDIDEDTIVELQGSGLLRLTSGRLLFFVSGASDPLGAVRYQIDTPAASARTDGPGEYRITALNGRDGGATELAVRRGSASLATEQGSLRIGAGEWTIGREGEEPTSARVFNSARYDAFDAWALDQRDARTAAASSTEYLPEEFRIYGSTLDRDGSWDYSDSYGYVWYPSVAADWRPYYRGFWAAYPRWGWTWIGLDPWAWPTHHYGRWGFDRGRWFWIPGRTWRAAWVSWASAPGYVSWCPLGVNGRPVGAFDQGAVGWTIVPRRAFGAFDRVDRHAVSPTTVPIAAFVAHRPAPVASPRTAPAAAAAPAATRGLAVPRVPSATPPARAVPVAPTVPVARPRPAPVGLPAATAPAYSAPAPPAGPAVSVPPQAVPRPTPAPAAPAQAVPRSAPVSPAPAQAVPRAAPVPAAAAPQSAAPTTMTATPRPGGVTAPTGTATARPTAPAAGRKQ